MNSKEITEKRVAGLRIPTKIKIEYSTGEAQTVNYCKDLGRGGVFIVTDGAHGPGTLLNLIFTVEDSKQIKAKGKVIWVQGPVTDRPDLTPGMGVQFLDLSDENFNTLRDYVLGDNV